MSLTTERPSGRKAARADALRTPFPTSHPTSTAPLHPYGELMLLLAAGLLLNSALGPLGLGIVEYPISRSMESQLIGLELVTTFLVVPWALAVGVAALRGHPGSPLLGFAPAAYATYMFVQYVLGPEYDAYTLIALYQLILTTLAGGLMLWSWSLSRDMALPRLTTRTSRRYAALLLALAVFVAGRYADGLTGAFTGAALTSEFADARTFYWSIFLLDLGVVVPGTVAGAVALLRRRTAGQRAMYAAVGWFALVPPSVASMGLVMVVRGDPHASLPTVVGLSSAALVFAVVAVLVLRPLLHLRAQGDASTPTAAQ